MPIHRMVEIGLLRKTAAATITQTHRSVGIACAKLSARRCSTTEYRRNAKPTPARPAKVLRLATPPSMPPAERAELIHGGGKSDFVNND
jgi:hypothetical protein